MKKIVALLLLALTFTSANANVNGMTIELDSPSISTNDKTYMSVFLLDENQQQIENATPTMKATPSYPVEIGAFVSCSSAEGRELCAKMDDSLVGLGGAYVSEITTKEIDENVMLTVYSDDTEDAKVISRELVIGEGASEEVEMLSAVPKVGDNLLVGKAILALMVLALLGLISYMALSRKNS